MRDRLTPEQIAAEYERMRERLKELDAESESILSPYSVNGRVKFTMEVERAVQPRFGHVCAEQVELEETLERFRAKHFDTLLAALAQAHARIAQLEAELGKP